MRSVAFAVFWFAGSLARASGPSCEWSRDELKVIESCRREYVRLGCDALGSDEASRAKLSSCRPDEIAQSPFSLRRTGETLRSCRDGVGEKIAQIYRSVRDFPQTVQRGFQAAGAIGAQAQRACEERGAGADVSLPWIADPADRRTREARVKQNEMRECVAAEFDRLRPPQLPRLLPSLDELESLVICLNPAARSQVACPLAIQMIAGGAMSELAIRGAIRAGLLARGARATAALARAEKRLDALFDLASVEKERQTISHLRDLVRSLKSPAVERAARDLGIDAEAFAQAIADSDEGKLMARWESSILQKSRASDDFLNLLQGKSESAAGRALRELLDRSGYQGRNLLPSLNKDQLRAIFGATPALRTLLHELPGIQTAAAALNDGEITVAAFQQRVAANLFHNDGAGPGSNVGFWQQSLVGKFVPEALKSSAIPGARDFLKGTAFEDYGLPISAGGALHASLDRLSQGTRGGALKIFHELGGSLDAIVPALSDNPSMTLDQLRAMSRRLPEIGAIASRQRDVLTTLIESQSSRLRQEISFIRDNMRVETDGAKTKSIRLRYEDETGKSTEVTIDRSTSPEESAKAMDAFLRSEERLHGEPMSGLPPRKLPVLPIPLPIGCAAPNRSTDLPARDSVPSPAVGR